jgi:ketosteroid isomerase-like protein
LSQANVDFLVDGYTRYNERDRSRPWPPDEELVNWTDDPEYAAAREDPDSATHRGIPAIRAQFARWHEAYPDLRVDVRDAWPNGDVVVLWVHFVAHGAGSGLPIDMELAHVWTLRGGKLARCAEYFDRAEAFKVAGIT